MTTRAAAPEDYDAVAVLDHLVRRAVSMGASDIHIEPKREGVRVRYRIDGVMTAQGSLPAELAPALVSRAKVLARMDMTERRLPQDGQFALDLAGHPPVHLRASTFPGIHGEKLVMRVLLSQKIITLEKLGLGEKDFDRVQRLADRPSGLILVCGPTGSGKTSTLYAMLKVMNTTELSVVTLEDPIEVEMPEITQGQANPRQGFTFAAGLRSILRQDPDVILVGEMRDPETAQIALQASLTGHLVLSTLHTSDVVETVARLIDLGAESWIVANALLAVVAQRLVRVLCEECAESYDLEEDLVDEEDGIVLIEEGTRLRRNRGCPACHNTGFRGRIGIFEVLEANDDLRELVKARAGKRELRDAVRRSGLLPLRDSGIVKVKAGVTSLEEVLRVT
ncbi:GspE/PulE family protein [Chondromyces apiculatus]|uniref:Type IV fimbrial assembly, ATPase PilB n=1 Tax=Chondromyces apiculatus DSM 436 TaxID=1192034 RepID=A0A017TFP7_9BACT|nr:GspE/PulE family protein [Chondromyces apiculatus]EYF07645.1 Type IV fimbrial assembly, ATPase PilB [Chondromyces apiculatus DSM 436]